MTNLPSDPVETVRAQIVLGARVMEGEWSDGERHVLIAEAHPLNAEDAAWLADEGELPTA